MVHVDTIEPVNMPHFEKMYKIGVHGDGSCLIHSFLYLTDGKYRKLSIEEKQVEGSRYRVEWGKTLLNALQSDSKHLKHMGDFLRNEISPFLDSDEFASIEEFIETEIMNTSVYLGEIAISILEKMSSMNIIIIQDKEFYARARVGLNKDRKTVVFHNIDQLHYEAVAFKSDDDQMVYVIDDTHKELQSNLHRMYKKATRKRQKLEKESPAKSLKSSPNQSPAKEVTVPLPVVVDNVPLVGEEIDPDESTSVELVETYLPEGDILFEEMDDLQSIMITRVNQNAAMSFTEEQSVNEIHELFSREAKGISAQRNQAYMDLLFTDKQTPTFENFFIPLISAHKQHSTFRFSKPPFDPEDAYGTNPHASDTYVPISTFLNNRNQLFSKTTYKNYSPKYLELTNLLFDTAGIPETIRDAVVRVCPDMYQSLLDDPENASFNTCYEFINTGEYYNMNTIKQIPAKYIESYRLPGRTHRVCGYLSPKLAISKEVPNTYTVMNVSEYFKSLKTIRVEDLVRVSFVDGTKRKAKVVKRSDTILTLRLNEEVEYKSKPLNTIYHHIDKAKLESNWCFINTMDDPVQFDKRMLFEKSFMFIFHEDDHEVFHKLFVPTFDEMHLLKKDKWFNIQECAHDLKKHFNISVADIPNHFIDHLPRVTNDSNVTRDEPSALGALDFKNANLLRFGSNTTMYPELQSQSKANDSLLRRAFALEGSFDNGMSYVLDAFYARFSTDVAPKDQSKFEALLKSTKSKHIVQKRFYEDIEELLGVREQMNENARRVGLKQLVKFIKSNNAKSTPSHLHRLRDHVVHFFTSKDKPQSIMNTSFLSKLPKRDYSGFEGVESYVDMDDVLQNLDETRTWNTDALGTYVDEEFVMSEARRRGAVKPAQLLKHITLLAGMFTLKKDEIEYIENNLDFFREFLVKDKIKAFKKQYPSKDVSKMFKTPEDKSAYMEYTTIVVLSCFVLIFMSKNKDNLNITKLHPKCKDAFELVGYPLGPDHGKEKSTLRYLSCLLTYAFPTNKNIKNVAYMTERLYRTTQSILEHKPDMNRTLDSIHKATPSKTKHSGSTLKSLRFKPYFALSNSNVCQRLVLNERTEFSKPNVPENGSHKQFNNLRLLQLAKSDRKDVMTFHKMEHSSTTKLEPFVIPKPSHDQSELARDVIEVSTALETVFDELCERVQYDGDLLKDVFVIFKDQESGSIVTQNNNKALIGYSESKWLKPWVRVLNEFNEVQHLEYITSRAVTHAIKSDEFVNEMHGKREATMTKALNAYMLSGEDDNEELLTKLRALRLMPKDYLRTSNTRLSSLLCMTRIASFCRDIIEVDPTNEYLMQLIRYMLKGIETEVEYYQLNFKNYTNDVEQMREVDKQAKFDLKDNMTDDQRYLYLNLEDVGFIPNVNEFTAMYESGEANQEIPSFHEGYDHGSNPEYEAYNGENQDD